jgi:hypothetical protein
MAGLPSAAMVPMDTRAEKRKTIPLLSPFFNKTMHEKQQDA